jgi:ribosomal protein S16
MFMILCEVIVRKSRKPRNGKTLDTIENRKPKSVIVEKVKGWRPNGFV